MKLWILCIVPGLGLGACASTPSTTASLPAPPPAAVASAAEPPAPAFIERSLRDGRLIVGGQPQAADFDALRAAGVTRVFNLRSDEEMAQVGYDEPAVAAGAGMHYTQSPLAGMAGFTPAVLEAFAAEMEAADGNMLLHCASGSRAGNLYAAWLVRYRGKTPDEAMRAVASLGLWPSPMARLLGRDLSLQWADPVGADSFERGAGT
jgi:uncharacterized protein (TIGR01244 family)